MTQFDNKKTPHTHLMVNGKFVTIRLDTMKDIDSGKKYTQEEIQEIKKADLKKAD